MEKIRNQNIIWTVSEDYNYDPSFLLFRFYGDENDFYKYALAGLSYKYYDLKAIEEFYLLYENGDLVIEEVRKIIEIALENTLWEYFASERPGVILYKDAFVKNRIRSYSFHPPKILSEELEYAFYLVKRGSVPKTSPNTVRLLGEILR